MVNEVECAPAKFDSLSLWWLSPNGRATGCEPVCKSSILFNHPKLVLSSSGKDGRPSTCQGQFDSV
jgi:hypothetical protein